MTPTIPKKSTFTHFIPLSHTIERRLYSVKRRNSEKALYGAGLAGFLGGKRAAGKRIQSEYKEMPMQLNVKHEVKNIFLICYGVDRR
jgi:hypothetical protein